ncbi:MAG: citramalate synthase [Victivallales bacterium]|nr:citramalate synthase [Victivallales bacterium]
MAGKRQIKLLDSTLRDGAQGEGISFSLQDKVNIVRTLDDFGIDYIEAGNPGSNPKDMDFFRKTRDVKWKHARLCAFGATRRGGLSVDADDSLQALLAAETPAVVIFGKTCLSQVESVLRVSPEENLAMIRETVVFFKEHGREVLFDAEHFFDGYAEDGVYALKAVEAAIAAGADSVSLCDTRGGSAPMEVRKASEHIVKRYPDVMLGVHCHNDIGCAVANSMLAVDTGVRLVQGTFLGCGERCGNADLSILIPNLLLKKNCECQITRLEMLTDVALRLAEIMNVSIPSDKPYIGRSAFAHKGGMHIDGMSKNTESYEHVSPSLIGNHRRFLLSEMAGRSTILEKMRSFAPSFTKDSPEVSRIVGQLKELEHEGYQFEAADASLELMIRRTLGWHHPHFELILYKTTGEFPSPDGRAQCMAMIEIKVGDSTEVTAALGNGPVHALDQALRRALNVFYPSLAKVQLTDFKVRVIDTESAAAARVRVLIESSDGVNVWTTIGVSTDIVEASWKALVDSIEYKLDVLC